MKRLFPLAFLATAALMGSAVPSYAGTFGLFYCGRWCNCCCVCVRPYNAFTPVCGGMGEIMGGGGCKWGHGWPIGSGCCCDDGDCGWRLPYFGSPCIKSGCCYAPPIPILDWPATSDCAVTGPTLVAGCQPSYTPAGMMAGPMIQPVSYQPAVYPAYPVYPMGYAPASVWGRYPMPASYPAPAAPMYGYPMGR
jgi:hypothetical protein